MRTYCVWVALLSVLCVFLVASAVALAGTEEEIIKNTIVAATPGKKADGDRGTAPPVSVSISGYVKLAGGSPLQGVKIQFTGSVNGSVYTDAYGYYFIPISTAFSTYSITYWAERDGFTFDPSYKMYNNISYGLVNSNFTGDPGGVTRWIRGRVRLASDWTPLSNVYIYFSNSGGIYYTGSDGTYARPVPYGWGGTWTPSKDGYAFMPASYTRLNVVSDWNDMNFDAVPTAPTFNISGRVRLESDSSGIAGATLTFSNGGGTATTDASGNFVKAIPTGWSGNLVASKSGYSFTPAGYSYPPVARDFTNANFSGTWIGDGVNISGWVRDESGTGIPGVTLEFGSSSGWEITDANGYYSHSLTNGWSGVVTPKRTGFSFSPSTQSYNNVTTNLNNQNYTGSFGSSNGVELSVMGGLPVLTTNLVAPGQKTTFLPPVEYNLGDTDANKYYVSLVQSDDAVITTQDKVVAKYGPFDLPAGSSYRRGPFTFKVPKAKAGEAIFLGYIIDGNKDHKESDENNNSSNGILLQISNTVKRRGPVSISVNDKGPFTESLGAAPPEIQSDDTFNVYIGNKKIGSGEQVLYDSKVKLGQEYKITIELAGSTNNGSWGDYVAEAEVSLSPGYVFSNALYSPGGTKLYFDSPGSKQVLTFIPDAVTFPNFQRYYYFDSGNQYYNTSEETVVVAGQLTGAKLNDYTSLTARIIGEDIDGNVFFSLAKFYDNGKFYFPTFPKDAKYSADIFGLDLEAYYLAKVQQIGVANKNQLIKKFKLKKVSSSWKQVRGVIRDADGNGIGDVMVKGGKTDVLTDATGHFITWVADGSGATLKPTHAYRSFTPESLEAHSSDEDLYSYDFTSKTVPTIDFISNSEVKKPSNGYRYYALRVIGGGFQEGITVTADDASIEVLNVLYIGSNQLCVNVKVDAGVATGVHTLTLTNGDGGTKSKAAALTIIN